MGKRILIFSPAYLPFVGGAEIAVKEITDRLPEAEFVLVTARLSPDVPMHERIGNVEVHRVGVGKKTDTYRLITRGLAIAEAAGPFDAVWAIMASYGGFAALRYKSRHPNTTFVLTLQEGDSRWDIYKHVWWCWPYFKQIFRRADRIQAISSYLADWARRLGAACPIAVVPNGVDAARFASADGGKKYRHIVTVSRLVKKNGVDTLIRAMQYLPPDTTVSVAGSGKDEQALKALAARLGLARRVEFHSNVPHDRLPELLAGSRVFCRPSRSEGLGNAFLEAMAAGIPVVGTAVGGIPDFLKDGDTGLVAQVGDPRDVAEKIKKILDDPALAKKVSDAGKRLVMERYEWNMIADNMRTLLL